MVSARWYNLSARYSPVQPIVQRQCRDTKRYNPNCITHQLGAIARSPSPDLASIDVPTLILYGTADPLIPANHAVEYTKLIANSQRLKMEGVGHDIPVGICDRIHPEIFNLFQQSRR